MKRAQTLRWHLVQVLLAGILPVGVFAAALLYFHWKTQDEQRARIQLETTRLLAAAVDNEIDGTIKRLTILGRLFSAREADPRQLYELPATLAPARPEDTAVRPQRAAQTVLVVEDNADERESLRIALELHGHRVLQAADARSALEQIESGRPSIALVDIGLPEIDGYALAREVRARFDGAGPVLVALTGYGSEEDARLAKEAGFVRHLTKPVEVAELAAIVSRTVS